jgi:hypothetical protein
LNDIPRLFVRQKHGISASHFHPPIFKSLRSFSNLHRESAIRANKNAARVVAALAAASTKAAVAGIGDAGAPKNRNRDRRSGYNIRVHWWLRSKTKTPSRMLPAGRFEVKRSFSELFRLQNRIMARSWTPRNAGKAKLARIRMTAITINNSLPQPFHVEFSEGSVFPHVRVDPN